MKDSGRDRGGTAAVPRRESERTFEWDCGRLRELGAGGEWAGEKNTLRLTVALAYSVDIYSHESS